MKGKELLRESIRKAHPEYTSRQVETFVNGREAFNPEREDFIAQAAIAYKELNPGASDNDVAKWVQDNEKRVKSKRNEEGFAADTIKQLIATILQDDKDMLKGKEIPDALAAKYPDWSAMKRAAWLSKNEALLLSFQGLHAEWTGDQLIAAVEFGDNRVDMINAEALGRLSGEGKANYKRGLHILGMRDPEDYIALKESFRKSHPEWTEKQIEIAARGQ